MKSLESHFQVLGHSQVTLKQPLFRIPLWLTAARRGQDKRGRHRSAAIPHYQHSAKCDKMNQTAATYYKMCALKANYDENNVGHVCSFCKKKCLS